MNDATVTFIEKVGNFFASYGLPRMGGQIWGLIMIGPADGLTSAEITEQMSISTGSVSTMARLLVQYGMVERYRPPGERRDRFRSPQDALRRVIDQDLRAITTISAIMQEGQLLAKDPLARARITEMTEFYGFVGTELPKLWEQWQQSKRRNK